MPYACCRLCSRGLLRVVSRLCLQLCIAAVGCKQAIGAVWARHSACDFSSSALLLACSAKGCASPAAALPPLQCVDKSPAEAQRSSAGSIIEVLKAMH